MKIEVVYCHPCVPGNQHWEYAVRFVASWLQFPPGVECDLVVGCNGGPPTMDTRLLFSPLNPRFVEHDNSGQDIGLFQMLAITSQADMMACYGESAYFHREGWLLRMVEAWKRNGPGLYASNTSNQVRPHVQTSGFACPVRLIREYPVKVNTKADRYAFEHGENCITHQAVRSGFPVMLVTWGGEYNATIWRQPENVYRKGDQSNCLCFNNHTDGYFVMDGAAQVAAMNVSNGVVVWANVPQA